MLINENKDIEPLSVKSLIENSNNFVLASVSPLFSSNNIIELRDGISTIELIENQFPTLMYSKIAREYLTESIDITFKTIDDPQNEINILAYLTDETNLNQYIIQGKCGGQPLLIQYEPEIKKIFCYSF